MNKFTRTAILVASLIGSGAVFAQASDYTNLDCEAFREGVMSGKIPATVENRTRAAECNKPGVAGQAPKDLSTVEVRGTRVEKPDMGKAAGVAGKGCGIGAVVGALVGVDGQIGCAVGGAIGFGWSYKKQLKEAKDLADVARAAGMASEVRTEQVVNSRGRSEEKLAEISIPYEAADMERMDPKTVATIDKIAAYAEKNKGQLVFRFEGGSACRVPLDALKARGVLDRHVVEDHCGKSDQHKMTISPVAE